MSPEALVSALTGSAGAVVALAWMVWMQRQDIKEMRREREALTVRVNSAEEAARTTLALVNTLAGRGPGTG